MVVGRRFNRLASHFPIFLVIMTIVSGGSGNPVSSTNSENLPQRVGQLEEAVVNLTKLVTGRLKTATNTDCPKGFTTVGHMTACYKFITSKSDWFEAVKLCAQENASLLEIDSEEEDEYIRIYLLSNKALRGSSFHTSGNDLGTEAVYKWFPSGRMISAVKWAPGEPSKGKMEDCLRLTFYTTFNRYYWYDGGCDTNNGRICKISM